MNKIKIERCLVCDHTEHEIVKVIPDYLVSKEDFTLVSCSNCSFHWVLDPPAESNAYKYYETDEYVEHSDNAEGIVNRLYHLARKWMLDLKYKIVNNNAATKSILDYGTGTGYFLNHMKSQGYKTNGIEISEKARKYGNDKFDLGLLPPEKVYEDSMYQGYGAITFWHVLEHVYDPKKTMNRIKELLDDRGTVIVALPNYHCLESKWYKKYWNGYDVPRHIWHFDDERFSRFAEDLGFKVVKRGLLPLDPFYNCLISESYRKSILGYLALPFISVTSFILGYLNLGSASSIIYYLKKAE